MTLEEYISTVNELRKVISAPPMSEPQFLSCWLQWGNSQRKSEIQKLKLVQAQIEKLKAA